MDVTASGPMKVAGMGDNGEFSASRRDPKRTETRIGGKAKNMHMTQASTIETLKAYMAEKTLVQGVVQRALKRKC